MKSDELIAAGQSAYLALAGGQNIDDPHHDLGRVRLGIVVTGIAHNMAVVEGLLADKKRFPETPRSDDDRRAVQVRDQLEDVLKRQNDALNIINGVLETDLLRKMQGGTRGAPTIGTGRQFFRDVADAIGEQRTAIDRVETVVSPAIIAVAKSCGAESPVELAPSR